MLQPKVGGKGETEEISTHLLSAKKCCIHFSPLVIRGGFCDGDGRLALYIYQKYTIWRLRLKLKPPSWVQDRTLLAILTPFPFPALESGGSGSPQCIVSGE